MHFHTQLKLMYTLRNRAFCQNTATYGKDIKQRKCFQTPADLVTPPSNDPTETLPLQGKRMTEDDPPGECVSPPSLSLKHSPRLVSVASLLKFLFPRLTTLSTKFSLETSHRKFSPENLRSQEVFEKITPCLIQSTHIFSTDIGMEFGIRKCGVLVLKRGKIIRCDGIELPNDGIKEVGQEGYTYMGIVELDKVKENEMKEKTMKEYKRRLRLILKSKLNGRNKITAINTWAVAIF